MAHRQNNLYTAISVQNETRFPTNTKKKANVREQWKHTRSYSSRINLLNVLLLLPTRYIDVSYNFP